MRLPRSLAALALAFACAPALRPLTSEDTIAGARALDTSYRVKDLVTVPAPNGVEYVLPIGEYRPLHADADGVLYAAPLGVSERAGFSKRSVPGGIRVANGPGRPFEYPSLWVDTGDGRVRTFPMPPAVLARYGEVLVFAVGGEERVP